MKQIFTNIINALKPIDIRQAIGKKDDNSNEVLKERHYLITVVDELLKIATNLGYDFCSKNGFIYLFNGQYWQQIEEAELRVLLKITADKLGIEKYQARYYAFIYSLLKQFFSSIERLKDSNYHEVKINLLNGTYNFGKDSGLRDFNKDDFLTYQLPFNYHKDSTAPTFSKYLNRVLPDIACQQILAEYIGYVFTSDFKQQKFMLLYGSGSNGKSVFFEIIRALLGTENVTSYSLRNLGDENCRALISNKLLNYSSEIDANINKETFKQLCSGEPLQARLKYKDSFMMDKYAKLLFNCNELPKDVEFSNAYFRRFLIIPFTQTIGEAEQDKELANKIIANELSGVFNWVLEGLERLDRQGKFTESDLVNETLNEFKQESDSVYHFTNSLGYTKAVECKIPLTPLYREYDQYCRDNGFRVLNIRNFRKRLEAQHIEIKRVSSGNCVCISKPERPIITFEDEMPF